MKYDNKYKEAYAHTIMYRDDYLKAQELMKRPDVRVKLATRGRSMRISGLLGLLIEEFENAQAAKA